MSPGGAWFRLCAILRRPSVADSNHGQSASVWQSGHVPVAMCRGVMHELSIMESALNLALAQARESGASRVHVLRLRIGALSGVVPDALQFAFEVLTPDTLAEGAELVIENVPARFWCETCRREFESADMFAECPSCSRPSSELRAGREMELTSLEIA